MTPDQLKQRFRQRGVTFSQWARDNGYPVNKVLRVLSKPVMDLDKITASASPAPNRWSDKLPSREMTKAEIQQFIDSFAKSAKKLKDAGVDVDLRLEAGARHGHINEPADPTALPSVDAMAAWIGRVPVVAAG